MMKLAFTKVTKFLQKLPKNASTAGGHEKKMSAVKGLKKLDWHQSLSR